MLRLKTRAFHFNGSKGERMPTDLQEQAQTPVEVQPQEALPTSDKPAEVQEEPTLPEDASERTKEQFEKLKEHNRQLKEQIEASKPKEHIPSVLDSLRPQEPVVPQPVAPPVNQFSHLNQQQVESVYNRMIDENGYVDISLLNQELQGLNNRVLQAERAAKEANEALRKREEGEIASRVYQKYPQLDPHSDKFDRTFWELTRNQAIGLMMKGEEDFMKAADGASAIYSPKPPEPALPDPKEEAVRHINATGNRSAQPSSVNMQGLVEGTRRGVKGALAERLRRSGY